MQKTPAMSPTPSFEAEAVVWLLFAAKMTGWAIAFIAVSLIGWAVSSLHVLAGWADGLAARLEIVKGMLASLAGGGIVGLLGFHAEVPVVLTLVGVFAGGYSGERYLRPLAEALLDRALGWLPGAK